MFILYQTSRKINVLVARNQGRYMPLCLTVEREARFRINVFKF